MTIPFWKMHGAGNDFILVDDRTLTFPAANKKWLSGLMARRTGTRTGATRPAPKQPHPRPLSMNGEGSLG